MNGAFRGRTIQPTRDFEQAPRLVESRAVRRTTAFSGAGGRWLFLAGLITGAALEALIR